jgi:hypothetical protein
VVLGFLPTISLPEITVRYSTAEDKSNNDDFLEFVIGDVLLDQVLAYTMLRINISILFRRWPETYFTISLDGMHCKFAIECLWSNSVVVHGPDLAANVVCLGMLRHIRLISSESLAGCELCSGRGQPLAFYTDEMDMDEAEKNHGQVQLT